MKLGSILFEEKISVVITSILVFLFAYVFAFVPNIIGIFGLPLIAFGVKVKLAFSLVFNIWQVHTGFGLLLITAVALLAGINVGLLQHLRKRKIQTKKSPLATAIILGLFGVGCAACGSIISTALIFWFGMAWLLVLLPMAGAEFAFLGIAILVYSAWRLYKASQAPLVCPVV